MPGDEDIYDSSLQRVSVLVSGTETGGKLALLEIRAKRGSEPPIHRHQQEDEFVYVLEGQVTFELDGERLPGPAGTAVLLRAGYEHSYSIESEEVTLLAAVAPAGLEGFYQEQCRCGAGSTLDVERLVTVAARYGVDITGSAPTPLNAVSLLRPGDRGGSAAS